MRMGIKEAINWCESVKNCLNQRECLLWKRNVGWPRQPRSWSESVRNARLGSEEARQSTKPGHKSPRRRLGDSDRGYYGRNSLRPIIPIHSNRISSKYAIEGLTTHLPEWENRGWIGVKNIPFFRRAAYLIRRRTAPTSFQWVKGHVDSVTQFHRFSSSALLLLLPHGYSSRSSLRGGGGCSRQCPCR